MGELGNEREERLSLDPRELGGDKVGGRHGWIQGYTGWQRKDSIWTNED